MEKGNKLNPKYWTKKWKCIVTFVLTLCLLIPANLGSAFAGGEESFPYFTDVRMFHSNDSSEIFSGDTVSKTEKINVTYYFEIPDGTTIDTDTHYTFTIPEKITLAAGNTIPLVLSGGINIGTVYLESGNKGYIDFDDTTEPQDYYETEVYFNIEQTTFNADKLSTTGQDDIIFENINGGKKIYSLKFETDTYEASASITNTGVINIDDLEAQDVLFDWTSVMTPTADAEVDSLQNVTVSAVLEGNHSYQPSSAYVYIKNQATGDIVSTIKCAQGAEIPGLTYNESTKTLTYVYPDSLGTDKKAELHYQTKLTSSSDCTLKTTVSAKFDYYNTYDKSTTANYGTVSKAASVENKDMSGYIKKEAGLYSKSAHTVTWNVTVNAAGDALKNVVVSDAIPADSNMKFVASSFKVVEDGYDEPDGTIEAVLNGDNAFTIDFGDISTGYTVEYKTSVLDSECIAGNGSTNIKNTAMINVDGNKGKSEAKKVYDSQMITMSEGDYDYGTKQVAWNITYNQNKLKVSDGSITLTASDNQGIVKAVLEALVTSGDISSYNILESNGEIIKKAKLVLASPFNKTKTIQVKTQVNDSKSELQKNQNVDVSLTAKLDGTLDTGGTIPDSASASANKVIPSVLVNKTGAKSVDNSGITWEVVLNKNQVELAPSIWDDELQEGLELDEDSVNMYEANIDSDGNVSAGSAVSSSFYSLSLSDDNVMTVALNNTITKAYVLQYTTKAAKSGVYSNTIGLRGHDKISYGSNYVFDGSKITFSSGGTVTRGTIKVYNYVTVAGEKEPLSGTIFTLTRTTANGNQVVRTMTATDANGYTTFANLPLGTYTLKQETVIDGYIISTEEKEIVVDSATTFHVEFENEKAATSPSPSLSPSPSTTPVVTQTPTTTGGVTPTTPGGVTPTTPGTVTSTTPGGITPTTPGGAAPTTPGGVTPTTPGTVTSTTPGGVTPTTPGTVIPTTPGTVTPTTSGAVPVVTGMPLVTATAVVPSITVAPVPTVKPVITPTEKTKNKKLNVVIRDKNTKKAIPDAKIKIVNKDTGEIQYFTTDKYGKVNLPIAKGKYMIEVVTVPTGYNSPDPVEIDAANDTDENVKLYVEEDNTTPGEGAEDMSPKTGEDTLPFIVFIVIAVLSGGAIIFCKRKHII